MSGNLETLAFFHATTDKGDEKKVCAGSELKAGAENPTCSKCGRANYWVQVVDAPLTEYNSKRVPVALDSNGVCSEC
jgi:hypothetical protein